MLHFFLRIFFYETSKKFVFILSVHAIESFNSPRHQRNGKRRTYNQKNATKLSW